MVLAAPEPSFSQTTLGMGSPAAEQASSILCPGATSSTGPDGVMDEISGVRCTVSVAEADTLPAAFAAVHTYVPDSLPLRRVHLRCLKGIVSNKHDSS